MGVLGLIFAFIGLAITVVLLIGGIFLVIWLVQRSKENETKTTSYSGSSAPDDLNERELLVWRYARGNLSRLEYESLRRQTSDTIRGDLDSDADEL